MTNIKPQTLQRNQILPIISLLNSGKSQDALSAVEALIIDFPDRSLLFNLRGACYENLSYLEKSAESFKKALVIDPNYLEAQYNLGVIQGKLCQINNSINSYKKVIEIKPTHLDARNNLGNALIQNLKLDEAIIHLEYAIFVNPHFAEAHNNLGLAHLEMNQVKKAIKNFEQAINLSPNFIRAYLNLGLALKDIGQIDASVNCYKKLLNINANSTQAHLCLGIVYKQKGQINDAINSFEMALKIDSNFISAYYELVNEKQYKLNQKQLKKLQKLYDLQKLSNKDHINLCFTLAKINEDTGNQVKFFKFLNEANQLRKQELNYSLDDAKSLHLEIKKIFESGTHNPDQFLTSPSVIRPIFIVGMPRSGSTLVEQILSSHKSVYGVGELQVLNKILKPLINNHLEYSKFEPLAEITDIKKQLVNRESINNKSYLSIRKEYIDSILDFNFLENIFTDKALLNFQYIGFILIAFPEAKIVHLKRDARAVCWSNYKTNFSQSEIGFANNMEDLAGFYRSYSKLMAYWHSKFPDKIYDLCYEDLTIDQENETKKLLKYCELEWDSKCLEFHTNIRPVQTASKDQVREKMYQGSSETWKKYDAYLKPLVKGLDSL